MYVAGVDVDQAVAQHLKCWSERRGGVCPPVAQQTSHACPGQCDVAPHAALSHRVPGGAPLTPLPRRGCGARGTVHRSLAGCEHSASADPVLVWASLPQVRCSGRNRAGSWRTGTGSDSLSPTHFLSFVTFLVTDTSQNVSHWWCRAARVCCTQPVASPTVHTQVSSIIGLSPCAGWSRTRRPLVAVPSRLARPARSSSLGAATSRFRPAVLARRRGCRPCATLG